MSNTKKLCPFCTIEFSAEIIRKHIGSVHLGLIEEELNNEIRDSKIEIKEETFEEASNANQNHDRNAVTQQEFMNVQKEPSDLFKDHQEIELKNPDHEEDWIKEGHDENSHQIDLFDCPQCDKKYTSKNSVSRHQRIVHEIGKFPCKRCGRSFDELRDLKNHQETTKHGSKWVCDTCKKSFDRKDLLARHIKSIHLKM